MTKIMLAFVPDPFIALYFKRCYEVWKNEADGLLVQVNGYRPEVVDFIADLYKDEFVIKHYEHSNQGMAFDELYPHFKGDVLGTMCSDNFIYKKGVITSEVANLDYYDAVGSSGLHASPPVMADRIAEKIRTCRLNPFMSFWNAAKLKEIEFSFQARDMEEGTTILGMPYEPVGRLDVMVDMYINFVSKGNRVLIHGADNPPYWMHASGLSSGVYGHLLHSDGKNLAGNDRKHLNARIPIGLLGWWLHIYESTVDDCPLKDFNKEYYAAIVKKAEACGLTMEQVREDAKKRNYAQS